MVAKGYGVEACFHEFFVEVGGEACAIGSIFGVGDDEVGVVLFAEMCDSL